MANVYVASKTDNWEYARFVMHMAAAKGHRVTYDWTQDVEQVGADANLENDPKRRAHLAALDVQGVREADLLVLLAYPGWCGALIEFGIAVERDMDVFLVGQPERNSIFFDLHMVRHVPEVTLEEELEVYAESP
jgi:hypothetical protein